MQETQGGEAPQTQRFAEDLKAGRPTTLSLEDYILEAYRYDQENPLERTTDDWHSPVWHFAWLLSGHPALRGRDGYEVAEAVFPRLQESLGLSAEEFWASAFEGECSSEEDGLADFASSFSGVRHPPGTNRLQVALFYAEREAVEPPHRRTPGYGRLISLAFWLHKLSDGAPIFLPCHQVAMLLGVQPMTVSRWRREAIADGLLKPTKQHSFSVKLGRGQATEFRFNPDALKVGHAATGAADTALKMAGDSNPIPQATPQGEAVQLSPSLAASTRPEPKTARYSSGDEWRALNLQPVGDSTFRAFWKNMFQRSGPVSVREVAQGMLALASRIGIVVPQEFLQAIRRSETNQDGHHESTAPHSAEVTGEHPRN
jgi:hypothetical protein